MDSPLPNPASKLIGRFGSRATVAAHFGISPEAVRLWLKNGIPPERALDAEEATRGTEHTITAMEVLLYAKQQRDGDSGQVVQLALPA
jgi:DNA-binding transcriptional regulator YdaS (Cro superfamily)